MNINELLQGESKYVEFKETRPEKSGKYMKTVVAFANGKGGKLIFGIEDDTRIVKGIPEDVLFKEIDAITNAISDSCEPMIIPDVYPQTVDGKSIIVVEILQGKQKPYYIKSEGIADGVYVRVSGTTRKADKVTAQEMYFESEGRSYDTVIRKDIEVSEDAIHSFCRELKEVAIANCRSDEQRANIKDITKNVLLNWGVLAEDSDGKIYPTNAYVYLNGLDSFHSRIQCGVFKGDTRAIFVDKQEFIGPLWRQVEEAFKYILRNIHMGARFEGVYRQDVYEFPPDSLRELIINAAMNCSFIQGSVIQVALYDGRLEITSPGGLLPGVTVERMKEGYSQIRNKAIAHAFAYMNLIEGWGTGIPRLMQEMKEYGLKEPEFIDMDVALRINLYRDENSPAGYGDAETVPEHTGKVKDEINDSGEVPEKFRRSSGEVPEKFQRYSEDILKSLTEQQRHLLEIIAKEKEINAKLAAQYLAVSDRRARTVLNELMKLGMIRKIGASSSTRYVLTKE